MKKKLLIIDRDGTLIEEPPEDFQVDSLDKMVMMAGAVEAMRHIQDQGQFEIIMVTNQDGLGTESFPEEDFWPPHNRMMEILEDAGIQIGATYIDKSFPEDNAPTRKPKTGLLTSYIDSPDYDLANSWVVGDRITDLQLAQNLGSKGILLLGSSLPIHEEDMAKINIPMHKVTTWSHIPALLFPKL
ncbi:MAG: imidazoleglycerol-phosphate dehydratase/histidinol-phosphatase [Candidatus Omnitrophota bacterium]|jgi:imidazoleglycerol-phosphate dehydratase/histidinol-phosphatase